MLNQLTAKASFTSEEIVHGDSKLFMGTLDVDLLLPNIPFDETSDICTNLLFNNVDATEGISESKFEKPLYLSA